MGFFSKKRSKAKNEGPLVIDPNAFLVDEGRKLASQERFMEAVMVFEKAEGLFRSGLANSWASADPSVKMQAGFLAAALGNHALVLARDLHRPEEALPIAHEAIAVLRTHGLSVMLEEHQRILETVEARLASG